MEPRERIRLGGRPIDRARFVHYFKLTHSRLLAHASANDSAFRAVPPFFRFLTCMAFLVFQEEAVDVSVVEVGVGGRTCSTNVLLPRVCGITRLGMDHMVSLCVCA